MLTWKEGNDDMLSNIMTSDLIISANKDSTEDHVFWPNAINGGKMEALEVVVWTHETSVKEGKGSRGSKVGTNPNNNMEGSRPVLILPHQPGRSPKFSKIPGN